MALKYASWFLQYAWFILYLRRLAGEYYKSPRNRQSSRKRAVESFDQIDAAVQKFPVRDSPASPTFQHLVDSETFPAPELFIEQIRIMNHLSNDVHFRITDAELFLQSLKRAVVAAMVEPAMIHVKRDRLWGDMVFFCKVEAGLGVNESADQPGGRAAIDARPGPRHPDLSRWLARFAGSVNTNNSQGSPALDLLKLT
jgi:hypothetical protein